MANLLHRLLRGRHAPEPESPPAPDSSVAAEPAPELEVEPEAGPADEQAPAASKPKPKPARRGPRKSRDEVSSIGPGEPV
jgi:hypothetical protein